MNIQIKSWMSGRVLFEGEFGSLELCVEAAVKADADLVGANLARADLVGANLVGANLVGADLAGAKNLPIPSVEEIARLDAVREIVLKQPERLRMSGWHFGNWTPDHTPEEEHACGSAHCIAGWLQALSPDPELRKIDAETAGRKLAPASSYMFFTSDAVAFQWLKDRGYATLAERTLEK